MVIGLIIEDIVKIGNLEYIGGIDFCDLKEEVKKVIVELKKKEKLDFIIVVMYMGYY